MNAKIELTATLTAVARRIRTGMACEVDALELERMAAEYGNMPDMFIQQAPLTPIEAARVAELEASDGG